MEEANRFYEVQAKNGVNLEGTFEMQEEIFFKNNLLSALEAFERGELPKYSAEEFQELEAEEQAAYLRTKPAARQNGGRSRAKASGRARTSGSAIAMHGSPLAGKNIPALPSRAGKRGWNRTAP